MDLPKSAGRRACCVLSCINDLTPVFRHQPVTITPHAVKNRERSVEMNDYQEELLEIRSEEYDDDEGVNDAVEL